MAKAAFLGLGVMGFPMAGHLAAAGHAVRVWNRSADKAEQWAQAHPGEAASSIEAAVADADFVMMCLGDDPDVRAVADKALPVMAAGAVLIDHTTASAELARTLQEQADKAGVGFVDAPVSGGRPVRKTGSSPLCAVARIVSLKRLSR